MPDLSRFPVPERNALPEDVSGSLRGTQLQGGSLNVSLLATVASSTR